MDKHTYKMRNRAVEGNIFYRNLLCAPEHVKTYFPPTQKEKNYDRRPKISFPVAGEIVDRLASMIYGGMSITTGVDKIDAVWLEIAERNEWSVFSRSMLTTPLSTGSQVIMLHATQGVTWESWDGSYSYYMASPFYKQAGYEYEIDEDGNIKPVLRAPSGKRPDNMISVVVDSNVNITTVGDKTTAQFHMLPFAPFVFIRGVDRDDVGRYAYPFSDRFDDLLIEYNLIFSQISKAIRILQSVWVTNKTMDNPNDPIRLDPDTVNFVGENGKLEQAIRELNIEPELASLDRLKRHISTRAQVPDFMTGLQDVGKIESGVALAIVSGPLQELADRIRNEYGKKVQELVSKSIQMEYQIRGQLAPKFEVAVDLDETIIPTDRNVELKSLIDANAAGLIAPQFTQSLLRKVASLLELEDESEHTDRKY